MKPLFEIHAQGWKSIDDLAFYDDRLEHVWKTPPTAHGTSVYLREALSPYISSQQTFAWGTSAAFRSFGWYFGIGLILHAGFSATALHIVAFLFYLTAAALLIYALTRLRREEWLYISRRDGTPLVTLRARGIEGWTPEEFRQKYAAYVGDCAHGNATI